MGEESIDLASTLASISTAVNEADLGDNISSSTIFDGRDMYSLSTSQNVAVGVYLVIAGILAVVGNASVIGAFARFRSLLSSPVRLLSLHLCIAGIGMVLLAGFLISGTSSLAGSSFDWLGASSLRTWYTAITSLVFAGIGFLNQELVFEISHVRKKGTDRSAMLTTTALSEGTSMWLFGPKGCIYYAFTGFLFGNANVTFVCAMTVTRCLLGMKNPPVRVTKNGIQNCVYFVWIWCLFWSVCPLLGWSSYGLEPTKMTCTINWQENDKYYVSYMLCLTTFVFLIPSVIMVICVFVAFKEIAKRKSAEASDILSVDAVQQLKGVKMCLWLLVTCLGCWSAYAVLCLWVVFLPPESVPVFLAVSPPLFGKLSVVINPLVILGFDDQLRRCAFACLLCQKNPPELVSSPEMAPMTPSINEN